MRRVAPRSLNVALERLRGDLAPATTLARVQALWVAAVGTALGREASPVSERGGVVTVGCRSAVWAQELALMAPDLLARVNEALAREGGPPPLSELRFVVRGL